MIYFQDDEMVLRDIKKEDAINLFAWRLDREIYRFDPRPTPQNTMELREVCQEFCDSFDGEIINEEINKRKYRYFIITDCKERPIGFVNIFCFHEGNKSAELGIIIGDKTYWNKKIGYRAVKAVIDYCFSEMDINRVYIETGEENIGAVRLFERLAFRKIREYMEEDFKFIVMERLRELANINGAEKR